MIDYNILQVSNLEGRGRLGILQQSSWQSDADDHGFALSRNTPAQQEKRGQTVPNAGAVPWGLGTLQCIMELAVQLRPCKEIIS